MQSILLVVYGMLDTAKKHVYTTLGYSEHILAILKRMLQNDSNNFKITRK